MGIVKTETFINEEGVERRIDTYENGMTIEYDDNEAEPTDPEPTEEELAQAEMLLMQAEILEKLNAMEV